MRLFTALLLLFSGMATVATAQDNHFTLHDYNPLWLNPAQTGAFNGSIRVGGIYRGQWYTLNGIQTPSAYADAPIVRGLREQDWIGVGANLISDRAGAADELQLQGNYFGFSAAYHLALDRRRRNVVTLGAQYGSTSYSLDVGSGNLTQQLTIDPILGGGGLTQGELRPDGQSEGAGDSESFSSINAGLMLRSILDADKGNLFEAGISALHLNSPNRSSVLTPSQDTMGMDTITGPRAGDDERRRRPTLHAHSRLDLEVNDRWRFQPSIFFQYSGSTYSASIQAWGQRNLREDLDLRLGLGYRTGDAAQVLAGLDFGRLRTAISYDITLSQARSATNYQGAFELSAMYIINIYKKPDVVPTMLCPRI